MTDTKITLAMPPKPDLSKTLVPPAKKWSEMSKSEKARCRATGRAPLKVWSPK